MAKVGGNSRRRRGVNKASAASPRLPSAIFSSPSPLQTPAASSAPAAAPAAASSIAQIKLAFASRLDSLRKETDLMHASLMEEVSSATACLSKRLKMELQSASQHIDELERDCSAFSAGHKEEMHEIKADQEVFVSRAQNIASQYLETILPEFMENVHKDIQKLSSSFVSPV